MLRITFQRPDGGSYWVECLSMEYNDLDGYMMEGVHEDKWKRGPATGGHCPSNWQIVNVEQV